MKVINSIILAILFTACSSVKTENRVGVTDVSFYGGTYENLTWNDRLDFKRASFYRGMNITFDIYLHKFNMSSPFSNWLSMDEKKNVSSCSTFVLALDYNNWNSEIKHQDFKQEMEKNGFDEVKLVHFERFLKAHPNYLDWHLGGYRVFGFCKKKIDQTNDIEFSFPGFEKTSLKLN